MKKYVILISIVLLFGLTPFIVTTPSASSSYNLPGLSYVGIGEYSMNENDKLSFSVSSGAIINVYIMTDTQFNTLKNSGGLTWEYEVRFKDITQIDYVFNVDVDNDYYVVFSNKGLFSVYIEYDISYIPYIPFIPDPYDPNPSTFDYLMNLITTIIIPVVIIISVILAIVLPIRHHQKKVKLRTYQPTQPTQIQTNINGYCTKCGTLISEGIVYCQNCGNKIN